tara:strand:- start:1178 stop:1570 length:393 start_codon:yes stop_codon:yes gene_type:complete
MSYSPYTHEPHFELNAINRKEGLMTIAEMNTKLDEIKAQIGDFENKKVLSIINAGVDEGFAGSITDSININTELQTHPKYNKYIPLTGKQRPNMADALINDNNLLNDVNNQTYILGTIAAASLVVLIVHM